VNFGLEPVLGYHPDVVNISNSEIQTFKEDRRKWLLGYYYGLTPKNKPVHGPLALGTRIHYALEMYYTNNDDPITIYKQSLEDDRLWLLVEQRPTEEFDKEAELGRVMLEGYMQWIEETGADSDLEVISAEEILFVPIMDGHVNLVGKLDMRVKRRHDGVRLFVDHKTSGAPQNIKKTAHLNWQPKMYMLLESLKGDEDERCDGMIYNILRKVKRTATAKPPFYERVEVRHNKATMNAFWLQVHGVVHDIVNARQSLDDGHDHNMICYPNPTNDSTWKDPFYALSSLIDDGSAAEAFIQDYYTQGDPYGYYTEGK
jgi:hypothetical protein